MTSEHDRDLVEGLRAGTGWTQVAADDPDTVARDLVAALGAEVVDAEQLADVVAAHRRSVLAADDVAELGELAGRVRRAEDVVAGAEAAERARFAALLAETPVPVAGGSAAAIDSDEVAVHKAEAAADRQAVRFALVILVLAQAGGLAVFLVDGDRYAAILPAGSLLALALVVALHRWPRRSPPPATPPVEDAPATESPIDVSASSPAVRAAEAHLRRQRAAWKVAWWSRGLPPAAVDGWEDGPSEAAPSPVMLVHVDHGRRPGDAPLMATVALPATVRVVVVSSRTT